MVKKKIINIPFESVVFDKAFNARSEYVDSDIAALKESIMASGLLQPIGVTPSTKDSDGSDTQYYIVYGFCRYMALVKIREELGTDAYSTLDVVLNEGTIEELRERNLKENLDRKSLKPHEIATAIKKMANSGLEQRDIAKRLGRPQSWVSYHYKAATKLGTSAWTAFTTGDLTLEQALNIADVPEDAQEDVVSKVLGADTRSEARKVAKQASKEAGARRTYTNKGRPTAKNLAQYVSDASYEAENSKMVDRDQAFYNGVAAGMRIALGDLEFEAVKCDDDYTDLNYHAKENKAKDAAKADKAAAKAEKAAAKAAKKAAKAKDSTGEVKKKPGRKKKNVADADAASAS